MIYTLPSEPRPESPIKAEKNHLETAHKSHQDNRNRGLNLLRHLLLGNQR